MIYQLDEEQIVFPHPSLSEEDGLLAVGGDLSVERLLLAYQHGIFPWYSEDTPILWYAPHDRFVLFPQKIKISKSMKTIMKSKDYKITMDQNFEEVITNCAAISRKDQEGTWIMTEMISAYCLLHKIGYAHSVEVWRQGELVGGLYGVLVGRVFCGESMFSKVSNASKLALIHLCRTIDLSIIDCQIHSDHLQTLGAEMIPQQDFLDILEKQQLLPGRLGTTEI